MSLTIRWMQWLILMLLLVAGSPAGAITYTINANGTVTDSNGLTWDRCSYGQTGTDCSGGSATIHARLDSFGPATVANRGAGYKGATDWRLPSPAELCTISLVNAQEGCVGNTSGSATPAKINATVFPNTAANNYWTGHESSVSGQGAMGVDFCWGVLTPYAMTTLSNVRLVRGGQIFNPFPSVQPAAVGSSRTTATLSMTNTHSSFLSIYYVVVPNGSTPPHPGQVRARANYPGVTLAASGLVSMAPNSSQNIEVSNLLADINYSVYVVASRAVGATAEQSQYAAPLNVIGPLNFTTYPRVPQIITFGGQADQMFGPNSFPINPVATGGASLLPVTYSSLTTAVCTVTGSNVMPVSVGTCTIAANQAGNQVYAPAIQVSRSFAINRATQTLTFTTSPPNPARIGNSTYTVSAFSNRGLSPIDYSINAASSAVCTINARVVTFIGLGTCSITASQAGTSNYNAAQAQQDITVTKSLSTTLLTSFTATSTPGQSVTFRVTVTGASPTGTATFTANGSITLCNALTLTGTQPATVNCSTSALPIGVNTIIASYSGNVTNEASASAALTHSVDRITTTTSLSTACMTTFVANQPFTLTSTVTGSSPTGSVSFNNGATALCSNVALSAGNASCTVRTLAPSAGNTQSSYGLTAVYNGDAANNTSSSSNVPVTVLSAASVIFRNGWEAPPSNCPFN